MIHKNPGPVTERLFFLGDERIGMYLVEGEKYLIIGGGMSFSVPVVERQLDEFGIDRKRIYGMLILHSHFDHCTAVPYFQRAYPHLEIMGSAESKRIFGIPKAADLMSGFEERARTMRGAGPSFNGIDLSFSPPELTRVVGEGDQVDLGNGVVVRILEIPGHSKCCVGAYVHELKALFPSDGAPIPVLEKDEMCIMANDDLPAYIESMEKMSALEVEICAFEHGGVVSGEEARSYIRRGLNAAGSLREQLRERLGRGESAEDLAREIMQRYNAGDHFDFIPENVFLSVTKHMVSSAA